jgi:hypothetical protein
MRIKFDYDAEIVATLLKEDAEGRTRIARALREGLSRLKDQERDGSLPCDPPRQGPASS